MSGSFNWSQAATHSNHERC
ncbi:MULTISPECIES: hypothetical protein [unclassified Synechococcus]|nr:MULTISPECIES: hypothetical protein [unclassified Synechococcus]